MLVLSRRVGEEIVIDGNIILKVVAIQGDRVRLGITAPPDVAVDRLEVHERRAAWHEPAFHKPEAPARASAPASAIPCSR